MLHTVENLTTLAALREEIARAIAAIAEDTFANVARTVV